jgi:hypothetical protein
MIIGFFQVTLLVLDKDLTYPLLLSINLLLSSAVSPSQDPGSTDGLPLPSAQIVIQEV